MTWDGIERRSNKRRKGGDALVTNDDLDEALAVHAEHERTYVSKLIDGVMMAFPDGVQNHFAFHQKKIDAAKSEQEFWDTAKKALITQGVSGMISGLISVLKIVAILALLGLATKVAAPSWIMALLGVSK